MTLHWFIARLTTVPLTTLFYLVLIRYPCFKFWKQIIFYVCELSELRLNIWLYWSEKVFQGIGLIGHFTPSLNCRLKFHLQSLLMFFFVKVLKENLSNRSDVCWLFTLIILMTSSRTQHCQGYEKLLLPFTRTWTILLKTKFSLLKSTHST